jgi:hypothetical protein
MGRIITLILGPRSEKKGEKKKDAEDKD